MKKIIKNVILPNNCNTVNLAIENKRITKITNEDIIAEIGDEVIDGKGNLLDGRRFPHKQEAERQRDNRADGNNYARNRGVGQRDSVAFAQKIDNRLNDTHEKKRQAFAPGNPKTEPAVKVLAP